jgi:thiol:disulfide interchange protein
MKRFPFRMFAVLSSAALLVPALIVGCSENTTSSATPFASAVPSETSSAEASPRKDASTQSTPAKATKIAWQPTFEKAQQIAKSSGKLIMIDFYTDWCGACKWMDANTYTNNAVIKESSNMVNVKVNAEKRTDLAQKYGIRAYPTLVWVDSSGEVVHKIEGAPQADMMVELIQGVRASRAAGSA